jgi:dihydrofolate reductase
VRGAARSEVVAIKRQPGKDMSVGGLALASNLASAGLIDEYRFYYVAILLGSGKAAFNELAKRVRLKPVEIRDFTSGTVRCDVCPTARSMGWSRLAYSSMELKQATARAEKIAAQDSMHTANRIQPGI